MDSQRNATILIVDDAPCYDIIKASNAVMTS